MEDIRQERRKLTRRRPAVLVVVHDRSTQQTIGRLMDLTTQGLKVIGKERLNPGSFYELKFEFIQDFSRRQNINIGGTCLWSERIPKSDEYESGLILDQLPPEVFKELELLLKSSLFENAEDLKAK